MWLNENYSAEKSGSKIFQSDVKNASSDITNVRLQFLLPIVAQHLIALGGNYFFTQGQGCLDTFFNLNNWPLLKNGILHLLCKRLWNQKEGKYLSTALYLCTSPLSCIIEKAPASSSSSIQINMQQHGHNLWSFGFMVEFMKIRLHEQAAQTNKVARTANPVHLQESRCEWFQSCHLCVSPTSNVCDPSLIKGGKKPYY